MAEKLYLYPVWIRIWHALNAILILMLILSGISMQYSTPEMEFIRCDIAVSIHNICGIVLTAITFFFVGNMVTPNGR
jgi:thiosulfate reductase cytochrome b subunit